MIPYKQLSLVDIFSDCQEKFENDKPAFLSLLETHIDIDEIIPISFRNHFYASTGRTRKYPLQAFLWALINPTILIRLPTLLCLPVPLRTLKSSSCLSMDIFVMSSSSALSPMVGVSSVISLSITKTLWRLILILLSKRNPTPLMKISVSMIQNF